MKILNCFLDNRFGGPQRRAYGVAGKLRQHDIETVFLFNEKLKDNIPIQGFKCFLIRHIQWLTRNAPLKNLFLFCLKSPCTLYKIRKIIKSEKIDIVHTNGIINILPALAAKLSGVKVIWHLNDTMTPAMIRRLCLPSVEAFSDIIAVAANKVKEHYFGNNTRSSNRCTTLYAPVDVTIFDPHLIDSKRSAELKRALGIRENDFVVGAIGHINIQKGYEYFIAAAKLLKDKLNNVTFLIVGARLKTKEAYWQELQKLISAAGLENDIIFLDFREDIPEILSLLDVFVLSSISEACPITVLEAMAMKVPIVATDVGGVGEQIAEGQGGVMVRSRSASAIAEGVFTMLALPQQAKDEMVSQARRRSKAIFSLDIIAQRHKDAYEVLYRNELQNKKGRQK
ncbi:glycosyltransferase family 4 protein [Candidatus Omnitrophota bacterium]